MNIRDERESLAMKITEKENVPPITIVRGNSTLRKTVTKKCTTVVVGIWTIIGKGKELIILIITSEEMTKDTFGKWKEGMIWKDITGIE